MTDDDRAEYIERGKLKQATDDLVVAVRGSWGVGSAEHNLVRDICDLIARAPGVSVATVGVQEAIEGAAKVADAERDGARDAHHDTPRSDTAERAYRRGRGDAATAIGYLIRSRLRTELHPHTQPTPLNVTRTSESRTQADHPSTGT